jgi:chromosomal replication initiation ATPase DnaA
LNREERERAAAIVSEIIREFDLAGVGALFGPSKIREISKVRHMAMSLIRDLCPTMSLTAIARYFGRMDHSTVLNACVVHARRMDEEPQYAETAKRIAKIVMIEEEMRNANTGNSATV